VECATFMVFCLLDQSYNKLAFSSCVETCLQCCLRISKASSKWECGGFQVAAF
jgi:hypothetical protein